MKQIFCLGILIFMVNCCPTRHMPPNNRDATWNESAIPLEIVVQWLSKSMGKTYVLDKHIQDLGIRIVPSSYDQISLLNELEISYKLTFKDLQNTIVISAGASDKFYDQFISTQSGIHL